MDVMYYSSPHVLSLVLLHRRGENSAKGSLKPALAFFCNHFWMNTFVSSWKLSLLKILVLYLELGNSSGSLGLLISTRRWLNSVTSWSKEIAQVFSRVAPRIIPWKVTWLSKLLISHLCLRFLITTKPCSSWSKLSSLSFVKVSLHQLGIRA